MAIPLINPSSLQLIQLAAAGKVGPFIRALDPCVKINLKTGSAKIDSEALKAALGLAVKLEDVPKLAESITTFASQGFFVVDARRPVVVPWGTVQRLIETSHSFPTRVVATDLGLKRRMSVKTIESTLRERRGLPEWLTQPQTVQQFSVRLKQRDDTGGPDPNTSHHGSTWTDDAGWTPPPPLPDAGKCITSMGTWSVNWWGIMLCLDSQCAQSVAEAIDTLTIAGNWSDFGKALVSAAVSALSNSSLVGFVVSVALAFTGGLLKIWILTENNRSNGNGVCIRFYFPYLPFIGGLIEVGAR
jgi:hypothetical protein